MKKRISFILVLFMLFSQLASCADSTVSDTETESSAVTSAQTENVAETDPQDYRDSLPDNMDFDGVDVNIHGRGDKDSKNELSVENENGDIINDAIYSRNLKVEERLNIKINAMTYGSWSNYSTTLTNLKAGIMAGEDTYDLIAGWSAQIPALVPEGFVLNLNKIPYLDLEKPWWAASMVKDLNVNGKLYFLTGDISTTLLLSSYGVFYNKVMAQNYNIEDLNALTFEGKWTLDKLHSLSKGIYEDLNGNGEHDGDDKYGALIKYGTNVSDGFMQGADISMLSRTSDGYFEVNANVDRLTQLIEKLYKMTFENEDTFYTLETEPYQIAADMFKSDRALFMPEFIGSIVDFGFNAMESDFGILPYPKLDEQQETYHTYVQNGVSIWSIPITAKDPDMSGAVMEALAAESYRTVTPALYETALKVKYSRDNETSQVLDIIKNNANINFETIFNEIIGNPCYIVRELMKEKNINASSYFESKVKTYNVKLDKLMEYYKAE